MVGVTGPKKTVLLVEGDAEVRDLLQDCFELLGYDVIPAGSGKQALDYLSVERAAAPDIVLLDLMLPIVSGWQVIEHIRRDPGIATVPVVVITAATRDKPTGASALFRKPLQMQALIETVRRYLDNPAIGRKAPAQV
jgi:CheY-like chemotaxis protein